MHFRLPPTFFLIVIFALFATLTLAEEAPPEDVCGGSTGGIDHLIYDENGDLEFFSSAVLEATDDWIRYPCFPSFDFVAKIFEDARLFEPDYKSKPRRLQKCIYTDKTPAQRTTDGNILASIAGRKVKDKLFVAEVVEQLDGFFISQKSSVLIPASFLQLNVLQHEKGEEKPTTLYSTVAGMRLHELNFCNGERISWRRNTDVQRGDIIFVLYRDAKELYPYVDAPTFILRHGQLMGPSVFLQIAEEKQSAPLPSSIDGVIELINGYLR